MLSLKLKHLMVFYLAMMLFTSIGYADSTTTQDGNWMAKIQADIAAREYYPSVNDKGLQAPNRAHNLRFYFKQGVQVHDRSQADEPLLLGMGLAAYGRGEQQQTIRYTKPSHQANEVSYQHPNLREWYRNSAKGLEQGFDLLTRPFAAEAELWLDIQLQGKVKALQNGADIQLRTQSGRILSFAQLHADDATGKRLPSRMIVLNESQLRLWVDDHQAVYPIIIDPVLGAADAATTLEANQSGSSFGISVASAGDVNNDGYADVIVGADRYDNGETDEGAAFVYHGSSSGISTTASTTLEANQASAYLGNSVASAGDVNNDGYADVIVGASGYDNGETNEGVAFVYHGSSSGLSTTASTTLEANQASAYFGTSVASAGDVNNDGYADVIVGASEYDNGETNEGAAFVYHGSSSGLSTTASTTLEANQAYARMGYSVASAGDVNNDGYADVIVGADYYDNGETNEGAAFVYHGSSSGLSTTASTTLKANQASAKMGVSVASAGDVNNDGYADVIVGADYYDNGETNEGAAFVYHGSSSGISTTASTTLEANQASAYLGKSVASAGDVNNDGYADVIVGAYFYDNGETDEGAAFVYHGSSSGLSTTASTTLEANQADAYLGISVASAGDVNNDGYADVIVGAPEYDNGESAEGVAFVYLGSSSGISSNVAPVANDGSFSTNEGSSITEAFPASDADGDALTYTQVSNPSNGLVVFGGPGFSLPYFAFMYLPNSNYHGSDSFTYKANDGTTDSGTGTITITINPVNDAPSFTASNPSAINEDAGTKTISNWASFTAGPSNEDSQTATYTVSNISKNSLFSTQPSVNSSGTLTYTPAANAHGSSTFDVTVKDNGGTANGGVDTSTTQTFTITIQSINDQPSFTASNPSAINEDAGTKTISNWANFTAGPSNEDSQTATYTVSNISKNSLFSTQPSVNSSGTLTYTPAANAHGSSTFDVTVKDNGGTANGGVDTSTTQTFTVTINPVNDSPSFTSTPDTSVNEDSLYEYEIETDDIDGDSLTITAPTKPTWLTNFVDNGNKTATLSGTPTNDEVGPHNVVLRVSDGTVNVEQSFTVTVVNVNDPPVITQGASSTVTMSEDGTPTAFALTLTATDPDNSASELTWNINTQAGNGVATASGTGTSKSISYSPAPNYHGSDSFEVAVSDGNLTATITVNVTINPVNDSPSFTSTPDTSVNEDSLYEYEIETDDVDGDSLTITAPTKPDWLNFVDNGNKTATLSGTPTNDEVGPHNVVLRVSDGAVNIEQSFTVTVVNVNDPPEIAQGASTSVAISKNNQPTAFNLTLNATDIDPTNDTLTWTISTQANPGIADASGTGASKAITYTPATNNTTSDSFTVQVSDGHSGTDTITVNVTFTNDPPEITEGDTTMVSMSEDSNPNPFNLTLNATDPNGNDDSLTWSISTAASQDGITGVTTGTGTSQAINYTPPLNYIGQDTFVVTVTDTSGDTDTITVTVNVIAPENLNDAPVASDGNFTINEDLPLSNLLLATDADGNSLTYTTVSEPSHGTLTVTSSTGGFIYTPFDNFSGTDSFTFKANDGTVDSNIATVNITINAVNDAPGGGFGKALDFDGVDDYVQTTFNNNLSLNNFTLSLWFKTTATGERKILSSAANIHPLQLVNGQCQICLAGSCTAGTTNISDGQWHFAAVIGNASGIYLYLDDNPTPEITQSPSSTNMSGLMQIGKSSAGDLDYFAGQLDEVRIWNIARDPTDIQADKYQTLIGNEAGLVAYYPFEDGIGITATDHKNGNNGTLNNMDNTNWVKSDITISFTRSEDQPITNRLPAIDIDSPTLTYTIVNPPTKGTLPGFPNTTGNFTYTPNPGENGTDSFAYQVSDGLLTSDTVIVNITLTGVNEQPSFTASNPPTVNEDAGTQTVTGWITSFNPGTNEAAQTVSYLVENVVDANNLFATAPTISSIGNLTYTLNADVSGTATFDVKIQDNGGTANGGVDTSAPQTFTLTVNPVNDQPTFTATNPPPIDENTVPQQIEIPKNDWITSFVPGPADEATQTPIAYTVSNISNSNLFAVNPAISVTGDLTYTPATNAHGTSTFQVTITDDGGTINGGIDTSVAQTFTITISALANVPGVTPADTQEDTLTTSGLVISRHPDDGPEVTHFKITNIQGGTLYHNNGLTPINDGDFITFAQANVGLRFLPAPNSFAQGHFDIQAAQGNSDADLSGEIETATITVSAVADTPTVTNTYTEENVQTINGLVISRNEADGEEVTHFKITNIRFGTLYQNDGITPIKPNDFITVEQGQAGLKFTPLTIYNGTFDIQAATLADNSGLSGEVITATVNIGLTNDPPKLTLACAPQTGYCNLKCQREKQPPEGEKPKTLCTMTQLFGGLVNFVARATDPDVPAQNLRFSLTNPPSGANINPLTGEFAWQPTVPGEFTFTIVVTDDGTNPNELTDEHEMTLTLTKDPILMPIGDQTVPIDKLLTLTAQAIHHNPFSFSLERGPAEATLDPETGLFEWTPTAEGNFTVTLRVTEAGGLFTEETFTINVERNRPPELQAIDRISVMPNSIVSFTAQATDPDNNTLIYRLTEGPAGATIHPLTGEFTWIPIRTGNFTLTVEAVETDGRPTNLTTSQTVEILVNDKPIILPILPQNTPINLPLVFTVRAIHAEDHPMTYALLEAPAEATIDPETGEFTWTPNTEGDYEIKVQVTETIDNLSSEATIQIAVTNNTPPEVTPIESQVVPLSRLFQEQVVATDHQANQLLYQLDEAPEGTVLHPLNGKLTWIPNQVGTYPFKISVTEIDGLPINLTASIEFELTVNTQPAIDKIDTQSINMGNTFTYQVTAFHPLGNPLGFSLINPPTGASIDPETGLFSWTPNRAGIYDLQIQVFDQTNQEFTDTEIVTLTANPVPTRLILQLSSHSLLLNDVLQVTGALFREAKTSLTLEALPIELTILGPDQTWHLETQTQADGSFQFQELPGFESEGDYLFRANFEGNNAFADSQSEPQPLIVRSLAGYAILIQGRTADDEDGAATYNKSMNRIYQKMKQRGFKDQDIEYFNFNTDQSKIGIEVDAEPSLSAIQAAFNNMKDRINEAPAPLFIVMVDHGGVDGSFYIDKGDGASIKPSQVSRWLNNLESHLNPDALAQPRVVVIGACYAGTFLSPLSKAGRIIIASADADEESFKGPKEPDEVRSGEFFTEAFFSQLARGKSIKTAFELATETTETLTRQGNNIRRDNRFQDSAAQHPLLDDDGDKVGSNTLFTGLGDGIQADTLYLGSGMNFDPETAGLNNPADILTVTPTLYLEATHSTGELFAVVNNAERVKNHQVIVDIRPPSVALASPGVEAKTAMEINELIRMFLPASHEPNRFSSHLDIFQEPGKYEVMYFVVDTQTGEMSPFQRSVVYKNRLGNRPPKAFHLQVPADNSKPETILIFSWDSTFDPDVDPFTYTLMIATDPEFQKVVYRQEELNLSMSYLDNKTPIDDQLKDSGLGLRDGTQYYWQVEAIDPYGARAISEVFSFTTNNTNAPPGIGSMHISSALDYYPIDNAELVFFDEFGNPLPDFNPAIHQDQGQYNMLLPAGRRRAIIKANGFEEQEIEIDTSSGFASLNMSLEPKGGIPPNPGQLQFTTDNATVAENMDTISVLVKREGGRDGSVSINYATENGNAIDGRDYLASQGTLTWADQDNLPKRITMALKNDNEPEPPNTFKVKLDEPTGGATLGPIQIITVTITDDDWPEIEMPSSENSTGSSGEDFDPPSSSGGTTSGGTTGGTDMPYNGPNQLQFITTDYFITEGDSAKNFPVTRLGNTEQQVSVQYAIRGGSATAEEDYSGGSGSLTWLPGDDSPKYPKLTILDDDEPEEHETIELYLFNPIGEKIRLGDLNQATLLISDNDGPIIPPTVQFSAENYTAYEGDLESIDLTVTRTGTFYEGEVSVQYFATADGTAMAHIDYQGEISGQLTWADGESEPKSITLQIIDDKALENPETVRVKLFDASGEITLGTPAETTLTIIDDEHRLPTIPLSLGLGMGVADDGTLYEALELKNLFDTQVIFWGGAKLKNQDYTTTLFSQPSQMVEIVGEIHVDPKHVGKVADILVVATASDEASAVAPLLLMLDHGGQVQVWNGDLTTLVGIEENLVLPETQLLEIFQGFLDPVRLQLYFGYRLQEDGFIYFNGEQPIKVWVEEEHQYSFDDDNSILFADWTEDGRFLVTASQDELVRLWDLHTGSRIASLRGHTDTVTTARFSPDDSQILTASADHTARLWEVATLEEIMVFQGHTGKVTSAAFSPDGQQIITTATDETARVWDATTGETLLVLEGHERGVQYATFSHDGQQIATASWDHTARLWDAETGEELAVLANHEDMVEHVAFSPDDQYLATTSWDHTARLWDTHTGQEIFTLIGHYNGVAYAAFSPDGEYLLTTSWDNSARLWAVKTGELLWTRQHQASIHHAAFSPDGQLIVTGGNDGTVRLWETVTGKPLNTLIGHQDNVWQVGFSPDGKRIISASWDNSVRVWKVDSGEVVMMLQD
jgi:WD40 repeat protein